MIKVGQIIYRRFFKNSIRTLSQMRGITWFAHDVGYGGDDSYGPIIHSYEVIRKPKLLNLDDKKVLDKIKQKLTKLNKGYLFDPDEIYSGSSGNLKFQTELRKAFPKYEGTWILNPDDSEWQGAQEIVLWTNFTKILKKI